MTFPARRRTSFDRLTLERTRLNLISFGGIKDDNDVAYAAGTADPLQPLLLFGHQDCLNHSTVKSLNSNYVSETVLGSGNKR